MNLMDDFRLAAKFLRFRLFMSAMTVFSVALGVSLIIWLQNLTAGVRDAFVQHATPYNLVVGATGSPIQLVLSSLFYLDRPTGNISEELYRELKSDPLIERAVPIALGDSYRKIPIVGTTGEFFIPIPGEKYPLALTAGKIFETDFEAVAGAEAARQAGLHIGSTFRSTHGMSGNELHAEPFTIVGILGPTGGPRDRAIYCSLAGIQHIHGDEASSAARSEVSAILIRPKELTYLPMLQRKIQMRGSAQAIFPTSALFQLFDVLDIWKKIIEVLCWIVVGVALLSISIALYSFVEERKEEIALMRALGASRRRVIGFVLLQSEILALSGGVAGIVGGHALMFCLSGVIRSYTGVELTAGIHSVWEGFILIALFVTGGIFGILPAWKAYQVSIADNLA